MNDPEFWLSLLFKKVKIIFGYINRNLIDIYFTVFDSSY